MNSNGGLDLFPTQDSAVLASTAWATGLVDTPANTVIKRGERVRYLDFSGLLG